MITIGSLFSGIGGLELGIERGLGSMGIQARVAWQCEIDAYCRRVLAKHWPAARRFEDINTMKGAPHVDVICGGFPCQDISSAGTRAGLEGARSGLFYELLRVVRMVGPRVLVLENVAAILSAGRGGAEVLGALAGAGFDARWEIVQASDVGAPHRRARWFCVAWQPGAARPVRRAPAAGEMAVAPGKRFQARGLPVRAGSEESQLDQRGQPVADANGAREPQPGGHDKQGGRWPGDGGQALVDANGARLEVDVEGRLLELPAAVRTGGRRAPGTGTAQPQVARSADGLPDRVDGPVWMKRWPAPQGAAQHHWEPTRTVAPRSVKDRRVQVKAIGNAVVPACAFKFTVRRVVPALLQAGVVAP